MANYDALVDLFRTIAQDAVGEVGGSAWGYVTSYDSHTNSVTVRLPSYCDAAGNAVVTPPIQLGTPWVGSGFGAVFAPSGGEQCLVTVVDRGSGMCVATAMLWNSSTTPPVCGPGCAVIAPPPGATVTIGTVPAVDAMVRGTTYLTAEAALFSAIAADPLVIALLPIMAAKLSAFASTELALFTSGSARVGP